MAELGLLGPTHSQGVPTLSPNLGSLAPAGYSFAEWASLHLFFSLDQRTQTETVSQSVGQADPVGWG